MKAGREVELVVVQAARVAKEAEELVEGVKEVVVRAEVARAATSGIGKARRRGLQCASGGTESHW